MIWEECADSILFIFKLGDEWYTDVCDIILNAFLSA